MAHQEILNNLKKQFETFNGIEDIGLRKIKFNYVFTKLSEMVLELEYQKNNLQQTNERLVEQNNNLGKELIEIKKTDKNEHRRKQTLLEIKEFMEQVRDETINQLDQINHVLIE